MESRAQVQPQPGGGETYLFMTPSGSMAPSAHLYHGSLTLVGAEILVLSLYFLFSLEICENRLSIQNSSSNPYQHFIARI